MMDSNIVRNIIGIIGNIISFGLFLSLLPTFVQIVKKKSIQQYKPDPYIATILNCAMWVLYGLPFVHPNNILVVTINGVGLGIEIIYITIFFIYSSSDKKKRIALALLIEVMFFVVVFLITIKAIHTIKTRTIFVGALCVAFTVIMYLSPLTVMKMVIKTKSVKYMPFGLSLTNFLNGACWIAYACIKFDPWMVVPNGLGAVSGVIQLLLYVIYFKTTDWSENEPKDKAVKLSEQT